MVPMTRRPLTDNKHKRIFKDTIILKKSRKKWTNKNPAILSFLDNNAGDMPLDKESMYKILVFARRKSDGRVYQKEAWTPNFEEEKTTHIPENPTKHKIMQTKQTKKGVYTEFIMYENDPSVILMVAKGGVHDMVSRVTMEELRIFRKLWEEKCYDIYGMIPRIKRMKLSKKDMQRMKKGQNLRYEKGLSKTKWWNNI